MDRPLDTGEEPELQEKEPCTIPAIMLPHEAQAAAIEVEFGDDPSRRRCAAAAGMQRRGLRMVPDRPSLTLHPVTQVRLLSVHEKTIVQTADGVEGGPAHQ